MNFFFQEYARCVLSDVGYPEEPKQAGTGEAKIAGSGPEWGKCDSPIWLQREMGSRIEFVG